MKIPVFSIIKDEKRKFVTIWFKKGYVQKALILIL